MRDICEIRSGGTPSRSRASFYGGDIPWAKISDIERANGILAVTEESITPAGLDAIRGRLFDAGTLLFAIYGSIGKMAFAGLPLATNQAILGLSFREGCEVFPRYVYHWLSANNDRFLGDGQGIAQKNLSAGYLRELKIPLPPLSEQRRIAAILDKADALRCKRRSAMEQAESLARLLVDEAYADADTTTLLGDLCDVQGGLQVTRSRAELPIEVPYLRVANVYRNRLDTTQIKKLRVSKSELERTTLLKGDILFVEGHGNADEIGRCAVWDGSVAPCVHQNHIIRARPISPDLDTLTLSRFLNSPVGRRHIFSRGKTTSGLNTISVSDVRAIPVSILRRNVQVRLRSALAKIDCIGAVHRMQLGDFNSLFSSLQSRAFSGQL